MEVLLEDIHILVTRPFERVCCLRPSILRANMFAFALGKQDITSKKETHRSIPQEDKDSIGTNHYFLRF